ncbi:MAG: ribonuclease D [Magnetococcales bacterium]|nr:ribonuclease D [Magnetococcales bacterium]MEC8067859.1 ribonuclease D [Pseudomonadota bacterium]
MSQNVQLCMNDLPAEASFPNGMAAVDCEMMGLNVFRDRLCMTQVANGEGDVWLVKFDGTDWSAPNLKKLLQDNRILKIFHYGRKDVLTMKHYLGVMTTPLYDTKIASRLTRTYTERHGLNALCQELLGVQLDKTVTSTNWGADELSEAQLNYAADDVIHLHALKIELDKMLKQVDRVHLAQKCFDFLETRVEIDLAGWEDQDIFAHH